MISCSCQVLSRELVKVFSSETYVHIYQETINILLSYDEICSKADIDDEQTQLVQQALDTAQPKAKTGRHTLQRVPTVESQSEVQCCLYFQCYIKMIISFTFYLSIGEW